MKISEVKKNDWIINIKVKSAKPWLVICKFTGMIAMRRGTKIGRLTALTSRQLSDFKLLEGK